MLDDEIEEVRAAAAWGLAGSYDHPDVQGILESRLRQRDDKKRISTCRAFAGAAGEPKVLHRDAAAAERLVERAPAFDVVVGAGDFASVRRGLEPMIDVLKAIEQPAVVVAGNGESADGGGGQRGAGWICGGVGGFVRVHGSQGFRHRHNKRACRRCRQ